MPNHYRYYYLMCVGGREVCVGGGGGCPIYVKQLNKEHFQVPGVRGHQGPQMP